MILCIGVPSRKLSELPLVIGWLAKTLCVRYLGPKAYRRALPMALGLVLGEFTLGAFWSLLAMATRKPQYHFWTQGLSQSTANAGPAQPPRRIPSTARPP